MKPEIGQVVKAIALECEFSRRLQYIFFPDYVKDRQFLESLRSGDMIRQRAKELYETDITQSNIDAILEYLYLGCDDDRLCENLYDTKVDQMHYEGRLNEEFYEKWLAMKKLTDKAERLHEEDNAKELRDLREAAKRKGKG